MVLYKQCVFLQLLQLLSWLQLLLVLLLLLYSQTDRAPTHAPIQRASSPAHQRPPPLIVSRSRPFLPPDASLQRTRCESPYVLVAERAANRFIQQRAAEEKQRRRLESSSGERPDAPLNGRKEGLAGYR